MSFYTDKLRKRPNTSQKRTMPKKRKILQESEEEEECERKYEAECVVGGPRFVNGVLCVLVKWKGFSEATWVSKKNFEEDVGGTKALAEMVEAGKNMMWWTAVDECEESDSEEDMASKKRKRVHRVDSDDEPNDEPEPGPSQKKKKKRNRDE
jgi:hypothetical protein